MSTRLETLDGEIFVAGFWGADTSRLMLGDLPVITLDQFAGYAADTLVAHFAEFDETTQDYARQQVDSLAEILADTPVNEIGLGAFSGFESLEELEPFLHPDQPTDRAVRLTAHAVLAGVISDEVMGNTPEYYAENPFTYRDGAVLIGGRYDVDPVEFVGFVSHYLRGGHACWMQDVGAPPSVHDAVRQLRSAIPI